ncbi:hypothetical protein KR074_007002 [Drosophila pseudoananassae]|nr:hypothetical protein KR074_007002 [Drosophila pseudoananassae]
MLANISWSPAPDLVTLYGLVLQFLVPSGSTVFYFNPRTSICDLDMILWTNVTGNPKIIWQEDEPYPVLYRRHGHNILVLACLSGNSFDSQLQVLITTLTRLRSVRILIELDAEESSWLATQVLSFCLKNSVLNVVVYFKRWKNSFHIYSFRAFPKFSLITQRVSKDRKPLIFPYQLRNLKGYKLRLQPDLSPPTTFRYGSHGEQISGFLWQYLASYAQSLNAGVHMVYPSFPRRKTAASDYMILYTRNGSVDFGLTTVMIMYDYEERSTDYSYPFMFLNWCTMLPSERAIQISALFEHVLTLESAIVLLLGYLLVFLGIPSMVKFLGINCRGRMIRLVTRLFTLILLSGCSSQLISLLIYPPLEPRIRSFDDLLASGLKIFGMRNEFYYLNAFFRAKYASIFHLSDNPNELYDNRNFFNTSWAYTITSIKWRVIDIQQRYFHHPVFRVSKDLCFQWDSPAGILIAPESIYRDSLKQYILNVAQSGLLRQWLIHSFYDMVRAGRMTIKDYSFKRSPLPLRLEDLRLCWGICGISLIISGIVFVMELLIFYTNVFLNSL